jgi:hypothetical protein
MAAEKVRIPMYVHYGYLRSFAPIASPEYTPSEQRARWESAHETEPSKLIGHIVAPYGSTPNGKDDPREQFLSIPGLSYSLGIAFLLEKAKEGQYGLEWEDAPTTN